MFAGTSNFTKLMPFDTYYDSQFITLKELNWLPWVGDNFQTKKILLVGESHYDDNERWLIYNDATRKFVNNQGLNSNNPDFKNRRFFQQIEKTLINKETSSFEERGKIWRNVGFFNLVQRLLPFSGDRPNDDDYDKGWRNFLSVVDILRPDICIKYGYDGIGRLGNILNNHNTGWARDDVQEFRIKPYCINLTKDEYKLRIIFTYHPTGSRRFYFDEWATHIQNKFPIIKTLLA